MRRECVCGSACVCRSVVAAVSVYAGACVYVRERDSGSYYPVHLCMMHVQMILCVRNEP